MIVKNTDNVKYLKVNLKEDQLRPRLQGARGKNRTREELELNHDTWEEFEGEL